jgi:hypothetical protein
MNVLALRGNGFYPLEPRVHVVGRQAAEHVAERLVLPVFMVVGDTYQTAGVTLIYDDDDPPASLNGEEVTVAVTLADRLGVTLEVSTPIRLRMP